MAVGQAAHDPERLASRHQPLTAQATLDGVDDGRRQGGQTGQRPVLDRMALPVRLAEQDRDVFLARVDPSYSGHVHRTGRSPRHTPIIAIRAVRVKSYSGYISPPATAMFQASLNTE